MTDFSKLDETSCGLLCQHPCCWSSVNRIERRIPRKKVASTGKYGGVNDDGSGGGGGGGRRRRGRRRRRREINEDKVRKTGSLGSNLINGEMMITRPAICDLFDSFPLNLESFSKFDQKLEKRASQHGLYADVDSQSSVRFLVPRCPPGSEEKHLFGEEENVRCVNIVQAFLTNGYSEQFTKPKYIWVPAKKKEIKETIENEEPSKQVLQASQILNNNQKPKKESVVNIPGDCSARMLSSKFQRKATKYRFKPLTVERQKTLPSDFELNFTPATSDQRLADQFALKKDTKGDLLQTRGLSANSRTFWKPISVLGSAANKICLSTLESKKISSQDRFSSQETNSRPNQHRIDPVTIKFEPVKVPMFEFSHGKMSTFCLELKSKDQDFIAQATNEQKRGTDFSMVSVNPLAGNHLKHTTRREQQKETSFDDLKPEDTNKLSKIQNDEKQKNKTVQQSKVFVEPNKLDLEIERKNFLRAKVQIPLVEARNVLNLPNFYNVEKMPIHRVRINNTLMKLGPRQPTFPGSRQQSHISSQKHFSAAAMTVHRKVIPFPPNEKPEAKNAEKMELTDHVDTPEFPNPPPPSPQLLQGSKCGRAPASIN